MAAVVPHRRPLANAVVASSADRHRAIGLLERINPQHTIRLRVILGEPPSKARARFTAKGKPYTPKRTIEGEKRLAAGFTEIPKFAGNLSVVCIFYRSTKQRIDVDNLLKAVLDAGTRAKIWDDDCQVTALLGIVEHDREQPRTVVAFGQHTSTMTRGDDAKVTCEACGERFFPPGNKRRETARWCSIACRTVLAEPVECPSCRQPFKRKSGNQRFCSAACRGLARSASALERTHCSRGHEMTPENTHRVDGRRRCRSCDATAARTRRATRNDLQPEGAL